MRREGVARGNNVGAVGEFGEVEGGEKEEGFGGVPARAEDGEEVCGGFRWARGRGGGVGGGEDREETEL